MTTCHRIIRAELIVGRRVIAGGYPGGCDQLDIGLMHVAIVVGETVTGERC